MGSNSGEESVYLYIKSHPDSYAPLQPDYILDHYRSTHKITLAACNHLFISIFASSQEKAKIMILWVN